MNLRPSVITIAVLGVCFFSSTEAFAQRRGYTPPSVSPLTNVYNRPTVSPYLNLLRGGVGGYQSLVKPLANNNRAARQNARQIQQLQRNVAQTRSGRTAGSQTFSPTGHVTAFRNLSHFYPNAR